MSNTNSNPGQAMSIVGLVVGILAAIISFVPCLGMYAVFVAPLGLIFGIIGFTQARKGGKPGMAIAAIVLSVVALGIAIWQYMAITGAAAEGLKQLNEKIDSTNNANKTN